MKTGPMKDALRGLWPRVDPYPVVDVLRQLAQADEPVRALFDEVCRLEPPDAATRLMQPMAAAFETLPAEASDQVWRALDALVRAGGDPSAILHIGAAGLSDPDTRTVAARLLRRAALRGWSLGDVSNDLPDGSSNTEVRSVERLAVLGAQDPNLVVGLGRAYDGQRVANLFPAIALLEEQLLTGAHDEARDALVALVAAGEDKLASWIALSPILLRQLRNEAHQREAARMVSQLRHATDNVDGVRGLDGMVTALAGMLDGPAAADAAASLEILGDLGADLGSVRDPLEQALSHPTVGVRSCCSRALSGWLCRSGEEPALPDGQSHRRVHAASNDALPGTRPGPCPACNEGAARVIFEYHDGAQFYASGLVERFCPDCRIYSIQSYQNPG